MLPRTTRSVSLIYCHVKLMLIMNPWMYMVRGTMVRPDDTNSVKIFVLSIWFSLWNSTFWVQRLCDTRHLFCAHHLLTLQTISLLHVRHSLQKVEYFFVRRFPFMYTCNFSRSLPLNSENERTTEIYCGVHLSASRTKLLDEGWCSLVLKFSQKTHANLINLRVKKDISGK